MDLNTSYVFFAIWLALYAVVLTSMACADRRLIGARWLAYSVVIELVKTVLQGMVGRIPTVLSTMVANELNVVAYFSMYLGFRWFVRRDALQSRTGPLALLAVMAVYWGMFVGHVPYGFQVIGLPVLVICAVTVVMMLEQMEERFLAPARIAAGLLVMQMVVLTYRMGVAAEVYRNGSTWRPPVGDVRWTNSMLVLVLTSTCLLLLYLWFTAVEMYSTVEATAGMDALTGCLNRRSLMKLAGHELARSERTAMPLSIVAIDIDHFKEVNDTYGHGGGDSALCGLCGVLKSRLRAVDVVARTGGEEFLVLLPDTDVADATEVARELRAAVEEMNLEFEDWTISLTISVGVTQRLPRGDSWTAMVARADRALYAAKRTGRNRVAVDEQVLHLPRRVGAVRMDESSDSRPSALRLIRKRKS
jgi:diguanylate cyclase (GGDEF)-like protein